jgi:hypothetical protein
MADINYLYSLVTANPTLYLDELQDQLYAVHDIYVLITTIWRALHQLAVTHKTVSAASSECNELLRATWQAAYGEIPMEFFVWSLVGNACVRRATFIRGVHYSVLPALSSDSIIALDIFEGSVNKLHFISWLKRQEYVGWDRAASGDEISLDLLSGTVKFWQIYATIYTTE